MLDSLAAKLLVYLVGIGLLLGAGFYGGYRWEKARWAADTSARDLVVAKQELAAAKVDQQELSATKETNREALEIQAAQSAYITNFLRKPVVHSRPVPGPAASAPGAAQPANGPGSGPDHPPPPQPLAFQDPDITGVALAGWEQLRLWRKWCHATPGCAASQPSGGEPR